MATAWSLTGKVALVTGATRGIGLGWAAHLLERGNTVIATARDPENGASNLAALKEKNPDATLIVVKLDTAVPESIASLPAILKDDHGITHIDLLVNNAGGLIGGVGDGFDAVTSDHLAQSFSLNTIGPFLVTQQLLASGLIGGQATTLAAYISSTLGSIAYSTQGAYAAMHVYPYRASKAALNMLIAASSTELVTQGVTSVALCPGYVATDATGHDPKAISVTESITSMLAVLEAERELNGKYISNTGDEIPW